jgi:hypothetical protein
MRRFRNFSVKVVVAVASVDDGVAVRDYLAHTLPSPLTRPERLHVVLLPCGASPMYLPYRLINWLQRTHSSGGVPYLIDNLGGSEAGYQHRHPLRRGRRRLNRGVGHSFIAEVLQDMPTTPPPPPLSPRDLARERKAFAALAATAQAAQDVAAAQELATRYGARPRRAFDFVYYTEADNVVFMARPEPVARALLGFLTSRDGGVSFAAPQRLEFGMPTHNVEK